jgi:hypothetical protein
LLAALTALSTRSGGHHSIRVVPISYIILGENDIFINKYLF